MLISHPPAKLALNSTKSSSPVTWSLMQTAVTRGSGQVIVFVTAADKEIS
jgi:hypothetical protein